jgi:hypothetical protein
MQAIQIETQAGQSIQTGKLRLTPFARSVSLRLPGFPGGIIWNRPTAVLVQHENGDEQLLPVQDITRRQQLALLGAGLLGAVLVWLFWRRQPGK